MRKKHQIQHFIMEDLWKLSPKQQACVNISHTQWSGIHFYRMSIALGISIAEHLTNISELHLRVALWKTSL